MKGARNDLFIHAFDKCPAYLNALDNLYDSDSWKSMEADHRPLLDNLGQVAEFQTNVNDDGYVPLSDVWNVFDLINVAKTECAAATTPTNDTDCEFDPLDDDNWSELQNISHLAEMLYKEADSANVTTVHFPAGPCHGATSCALGDFTQLLSSMSYTSLEEWCVLCENDSADVCLEVKLDALSAQDTTISAVTPQGEDSNKNSGSEKIDSNSIMSESLQNASSNNNNVVMIKDDRFLNKVIVITGAGGSFGREGCIYFAQRGAKIAALEINSSSLAETVSELSKACPWGAQVCALECNVTSAEAVSDTMQIIQTRLGPIDMLWNNAGYQGEIKPTLEYDPQDFARVMDINVTGMFIVLQAAARCMAHENRGGSIVNTASVAGLRGTPAMVAYVSSKAAVLGMTVSTSKDLAPHNIRVNAVSPALIGPGYMWTRQNELHAASGSPYFASNPEVVATGKINSVPMKRLGTVEEVIKSVAFLLSSEASYTTGVNLVIDGGMSGGLKA